MAAPTTRPAGPPVYFLHGLLGTAYAHFGNQVVHWQDSVRCVPIDLPGHGRCAVDAGPGYLAVALEYVTALIQRFGRGRVVAASYLGGPLAVRLAATRPDLVESLVLTGFAPGLTAAVFARWLTGFELLAAQSPALVEQYERLHGQRWRHTFDAFSADAVAAYGKRMQVSAADLGALDPPVLIINGSAKSIERSAAEQAAGYGPRVGGRVLAGAGHIASHDAPAAFNRQVAAFWQEGPQR